MYNPTSRLLQGWVEVVQREMHTWLEYLLKDAFDPAALLSFMQAMGIELSQLPGMVGKKPGFDPYRVLGLDKSASDEEVKKRYRSLLFRLHPDMARDEGTDFLFQMVVAAYELIKRERGWK